MASKSTKPGAEPPASAAGLFDSQLAGAVKASAQQIWLAGMGAFAKAQAEGTRVFDALVKEGTGLQRKTQPGAQERASEAAERVNTLAAEVGSKASASWDRLENLFEERTAKALRKLGVPTAAEVEVLARRVEELSAAVEKLSAGHATTPAGSPAPRKTATKRASPSASAAKATPAKPAEKAAVTARAPRKRVTKTAQKV